MNLLISALGNGTFSKSVQSSLVAPPQLLSDRTPTTHPALWKLHYSEKISGYIKHNSVAFDSSLEARRSLQRTHLSQSLIHEQVGHLKIWRAERKLSAKLLFYRSFSSSSFQTWMVKILPFSLFHHSFATLEFYETVCLLTICPLVEHPAPPSLRTSKKGIFEPSCS